jgi:transposase
MAALFSDGSVVNSRCWCSSTSEIFLGFVGKLAKTVTKPLVIARDNASIHRAWAIPPALKLLEKKAIRLKFLPPYSPELNRIETLWRLIKHRWMALTWRTPKKKWSKRWTLSLPTSVTSSRWNSGVGNMCDLT